MGGAGQGIRREDGVSGATASKERVPWNLRDYLPKPLPLPVKTHRNFIGRPAESLHNQIKI
jgi:hypothetical protein